MSDATNARAGRGRRALVLAVALAALATLLVAAGCGGSDDNDSNGSSADSAETTETTDGAATEVSPEELQETVDTALATTDIPADTLPEMMQQSLARATPEPSQEVQDQAFECWQGTSCTVGDGEITLALADGFGDNTWRQFSKMNVILQALTHPEVGKLIFTNASGDLAKFQSDIRSLSAQGATAIVSYNDFGPAAYPAYTAAQRAGAVVSTFVSPGDGAPTSAITTRVQPDICQAGKDMAAVTKEVVGDAPVAYFTGTPGNPQDTAWQKCATEEGINAVFKADTDWTPAGAQKAAAALIASGEPAEAILYSYSNPVPNIVRTFNRAGEEIPAIITWTQDNGTSCQWEKEQYTLYQTHALNWAARVSVDATLAKLAGDEVPDELVYPLPFIPAKEGDCNPDAPADYPGKSALVPDALTDRILGAAK